MATHILLWISLPSGDLGELSVSSEPRLWDSCLLKWYFRLRAVKIKPCSDFWFLPEVSRRGNLGLAVFRCRARRPDVDRGGQATGGRRPCVVAGWGARWRHQHILRVAWRRWRHGAVLFVITIHVFVLFLPLVLVPLSNCAQTSQGRREPLAANVIKTMTSSNQTKFFCLLTQLQTVIIKFLKKVDGREGGEIERICAPVFSS